MRRAMQHLSLIATQRYCVRQQRRIGDTHDATVSRFVPGSVARLFEHVGPTPKPRDALRPAAPPSIDVGAKIRGMWD